MKQKIVILAALTALVGWAGVAVAGACPAWGSWRAVRTARVTAAPRTNIPRKMSAWRKYISARRRCAQHERRGHIGTFRHSGWLW